MGCLPSLAGKTITKKVTANHDQSSAGNQKAMRERSRVTEGHLPRQGSQKASTGREDL
jgi:hypothetical protein